MTVGDLPGGSEASQADIQVQAYLVWEAAGCPDGNALDHWIQAQQLVSASAGKPRQDGFAFRRLAAWSAGRFAGYTGPLLGGSYRVSLGR